MPLYAREAVLRALPVFRATETVPGRVVLVQGAIDHRSAAALRAVLMHAEAGGQGELTLDLTCCEIGDSTGLGVIVGAHHRMQLGGRKLVLTSLSPRTLRLLRVTGLHRVLWHTDAHSSASTSLPA
ncbi:STAS domain-containing protein [Calidifontibacter sp. DB0510]|uniref:Anti-sigma factor antagonist n=1 Tax=Metallococcus carri TaxID=1656884 RepID=A0A967B1N0_9MICO|nr:STAS domain-containing protein [Metallococcus carri]NHN56349.1 STAS domain-containing protein [Metallococcus carri]NOP35973.1 STAS domain-containing protein [Calidifontibacter sp. DB2511S]